MRRLLLAAGALAAACWVLPASAEDPAPAPRCALLGQIAVSTWLELLGGLNQKDDPRVSATLQRLASATDSYSAVACDSEALGVAFDCLLERSGETHPRTLARACMDTAGLTAAK